MQDGLSDSEPFLKTRMTDDLLPEWKQKQDFLFPIEELKFEEHIIGFGNFTTTEWYFIFSDGVRSDFRSNTRLLDFNENFI